MNAEQRVTLASLVSEALQYARSASPSGPWSSLDIDLVESDYVDDAESMSDDELERAMTSALGRFGDLRVTLLRRSGRAGGNPSVRISGPRSHIAAFLRDRTAGDAEDMRFYTKMIRMAPR